MAAYKLKTAPNTASVKEYITSIESEQRRKDCEKILDIMKQITGKKPVMWGKSIIGFGKYHYQASSYESSWFRCGFSSRKQSLTIYLISGYDKMQDLLEKLGKFTHSVSCLYVKRLSDIDLTILKEMITRCLALMEEYYPEDS